MIEFVMLVASNCYFSEEAIREVGHYDHVKVVNVEDTLLDEIYQIEHVPSFLIRRDGQTMQIIDDSPESVFRAIKYIGN